MPDMIAQIPLPRKALGGLFDRGDVDAAGEPLTLPGCWVEAAATRALATRRGSSLFPVMAAQASCRSGSAARPASSWKSFHASKDRPRRPGSSVDPRRIHANRRRHTRSALSLQGGGHVLAREDNNRYPFAGRSLAWRSARRMRSESCQKETRTFALYPPRPRGLRAERMRAAHWLCRPQLGPGCG